MNIIVKINLIVFIHSCLLLKYILKQLKLKYDLLFWVLHWGNVSQNRRLKGLSYYLEVLKNGRQRSVDRTWYVGVATGVGGHLIFLNRKCIFDVLPTLNMNPFLDLPIWIINLSVEVNLGERQNGCMTINNDTVIHMNGYKNEQTWYINFVMWGRWTPSPPAKIFSWLVCGKKRFSCQFCHWESAKTSHWQLFSLLPGRQLHPIRFPALKNFITSIQQSTSAIFFNKSMFNKNSLHSLYCLFD